MESVKKGSAHVPDDGGTAVENSDHLHRRVKTTTLSQSPDTNPTEQTQIVK